jgi:hypothetical protein
MVRVWAGELMLMPLAHGLGLFAVTWMLFRFEPIFDTSWFDEMLGLSRNEGVIAAMFFLVGLQVGIVAQSAYRIAKAHDLLVDKLYGRDDS